MGERSAPRPRTCDEWSRGMSPFNTAVYATRNDVDLRVTVAFGQRFERRAGGVTSTHPVGYCTGALT